MRRRLGFFDVDDQLKRLGDLGNRLTAFRSTGDFEASRVELKAALCIRVGRRACVRGSIR